MGEKRRNADRQVSCYLTLAQLEHLEGHPNQAKQALDKARGLAANHQLTPGPLSSRDELAGQPGWQVTTHLGHPPGW